MKDRVVTFGCRLNAYESEIMRSFVDESQDDILVFNTCAVTKEAERQAKQAIRKARRENPHVKIVVTGCAAQTNPEGFQAMEEVDRVLGNEEKLHKHNFDFSGQTEKAIVNDIFSVKETAAHLIPGFDGKARAFIQVQNGCNHRCTFCIIPYGRGNSRSVPIGHIVEQTRLLVEHGYKEIVLTGVDITSYGEDLPGTPTLGQMTRRLLALVPGLQRLRISSIDSIEADEDLYRLIAEEPRLMPHFHLSLQAGDNLTLKRMKRRHLRDDAINICAKMRELRPDVVFGADLIAGFPTETDAMFENTLNIVRECGLTYLHVFPYSPRPGTPAARMPQVEKAVIKERAKRLREVGQRQQASYFSSLVGTTQRVLIENETNARTEHYAPVKLVSGEYKPEHFYNVELMRITSATNDHVIGEII